MMDDQLSNNNLALFIIIEFQNQMESENESRSSIQSSNTQYINLPLKGQAQILKNLCKLINNQISLELHTINSNVNDRLKATYQQILIQFKVDLRKMQKLRLDKRIENDQISILQSKIQEHIKKIVKLKEINIYFGDLEKQSNSLERDVQKFLFYQPKSENLQEKLQTFFSSPLVSELFLKEYERSFNMNNFSADLIDFFFFLHSNGLLQIPQPQTYHPIRNKDLMLIENANVIFRQICDINDKYAHVEHQLEGSYVHLKFIQNQHHQGQQKGKFKVQQAIIQQKFVNLKTIFNKIKCIYGGIQFNNLQGRQQTIILPQEPSIVEMLSQKFEYHSNQRNEQFLTFLQNLYDPNNQLGLQEPGKVHFDFLRQKIIKAETRWHLNRLISAFNVGSYIVNQLQTNLNLTHNTYSFTNPWILSKYQFNSSRMNFFTCKPCVVSQLFILNKNAFIAKTEDSYILKVDKDKAVYPSTVNNYLYLLKYLYLLSCILKSRKIYSQELMLELIEIKADEMMEWAQISINLYELIKSKYFRCYDILQKYISLIFQINYAQQLDYLQKQLKEGAEGVSFVLERFISKEKKAGCISQIIFQFEADYDIREALLKLYTIEKSHKLTFYCTDSPVFYQTVLNQIIETKNNLKFDRCLSFNSLHQIFGFLAARPNDLKDLAQQLTPLSKKSLRLPDLLKFYATQTKLKREVFKAQLYWITITQNTVKNKFIINSQRKKVNFKDFLQENAKCILSLGDKPLSYFLTNLEQFERSVLLFSQQVQRLKLIQSSLLYLKPDFPLQNHISAFSHKQLIAFFNYCSHFNLIQDLYIRRDKKNWILSNIKKIIVNGKLKFNDLAIESSIMTLKDQLSNYIFFMYSFQHHYTYEDCIKFIKRVVKGSQPPEYALKLQILRSKRDILKEYQEGQFMDTASLSELTQIYELLLLVGVNRLLRTKQLQKKDIALFQKIRKQLPLYQCFKAIDTLEGLEDIKQYSSIKSKVHTLGGLKSILLFYKQSRQITKKYQGEWAAIQNLGLMAEIGIVSRRLFCNQIVQLKRVVSADDWRSFNKTICLNNLKYELDKELLSYVNAFIRNNLAGVSELDLNTNLNEHILFMEELFRKEIFNQYDQKYSLEVIKKDSIVLFDEFRGYEVQYQPKEQDSQPRKNVKNRANYKRGMLNTLKRQDHGSTQIINDLQHRINLQIVKQSLPIRKLIYQLQLQQKRIRDQISWETCKLQHNVISKINQFIQESNLDQKQSLINFKYTVNLETIKGIQNVIHERAEIFHKNNQEQLNQTQEHNGFITEPRDQKKEKKEKNNEEQTLLDVNVKNIFNHVKKLKIFWAWKNIHLQKQSSQEQWVKFSDNVEKILHNNENLKKMQNLQQLRENCNKHEIICNLIKEQNVLLNGSIKKMKVNTLTKKLDNFKERYKIEQEALNI